jgi:hypothetical protein
MSDDMTIRGSEAVAPGSLWPARPLESAKPDEAMTASIPSDKLDISTMPSGLENDARPVAAADEAVLGEVMDPTSSHVISAPAGRMKGEAEDAPASIFIESPRSEEERKRALIEELMEDRIGEGKREKIQRRLGKYPEKALELMNLNGVTILDKPLSLWDSVAGGYRPAQRDIQIGRGGYIDFFIDHPALSAIFGGKYPPAVMGSIKIAAAAAVAAFIALPVSMAALATGGLALSPLSLILLSRMRSRSVKDPLEHEAAHALDLALGRAEKNRDMSICEDTTRDTAIPHYTYEKECIPFSLKSPEIAACYKSCKEGRATFVTDYAATLLEEYFAESVRAYVNVEKSGSDACREDLKKKDPAMYKFVERMFENIASEAYGRP